MVVLDVFTKNLLITYKSTLFSKATFLVLAFECGALVLPFIFAYYTNGLWLKRDIFYEQPDVKFKGEYLFVGTTNSIRDNLIVCSTISIYKEIFNEFDRCSSVKVREIDDNFDGKVEELRLNVLINLPNNTFFTSFFIFIPLAYSLSICKFQMQSAILHQEVLPFIMRKAVIYSQAMMAQLAPLNCGLNDKHQLLLANNIESIAEVEDIIEDYSKRQYSTVLKNTHTYFMPGSATTFDLNFNVKYPEDRIVYKPKFWQVLKLAWIQYLSIYIVLSWFLTRIKRYIFNKRLVLYYEDNPLKKKQ